MDLFGADFEDFNKDNWLVSGHDNDALLLNVRVVTADGKVLNCENTSRCNVRYKREFTPHLHDVSPNQVAKGMRADFIFDINGVHGNFDGNKLTPKD